MTLSRASNSFILTLVFYVHTSYRTHSAKVHVSSGEFVQGALAERVRKHAAQRRWYLAVAKSDGARTEDGFLWRSVGVAESGDGFGDDEERKDDGKLLPKVAEEEGCHNGGKGRSAVESF
jgi:hypothetical protein